MKKKFLSIFVAFALVATMFSTTLAFAEEEPTLANFKITRSGENQVAINVDSSHEGILTLWWYDDSYQPLGSRSNMQWLQVGSNSLVENVPEWPLGATYIKYSFNMHDPVVDFIKIPSWDATSGMEVSVMFAMSKIGDKGRFNDEVKVEKDEFTFAFTNNKSGKVSYEWFLEGKAIGSRIESITSTPIPFGSNANGFTLDNLSGADTFSVTITDLSGNIAYQETFPVVVMKNLEVKRTGLNEVEITFVSDYEGELSVGLHMAYYGMKGASGDFIASSLIKGQNKIISPIVDDAFVEYGYFSSIYDNGTFSGPRFSEGQEGPLEMSLYYRASGSEYYSCSQYITIPAFDPAAEETSGVILPSTPDSDKFTWTGEGEASFRLDADPKTFVKLYEGDKKSGKEVNESNYTITAGSTIITLKEDYVKTLENGTYLYTAEFEDGDAVLKLIVDTESDGKKSLIPKSGDANRAAGIVVLIASLALAGASFRALRKEQTKE